MKAILCVLVALFVLGGAAFGQNRLLPGVVPQWKLHLIPAPGLHFEPLEDPRSSGVVALTSANRVRILFPDNMPCRFPDLAGVERMPVRHLSSGDQMPNCYRSRSKIRGVH